MFKKLNCAINHQKYSSCSSSLSEVNCFFSCHPFVGLLYALFLKSDFRSQKLFQNLRYKKGDISVTSQLKSNIVHEFSKTSNHSYFFFLADFSFSWTSGNQDKQGYCQWAAKTYYPSHIELGSCGQLYCRHLLSLGPAVGCELHNCPHDAAFFVLQDQCSNP